MKFADLIESLVYEEEGATLDFKAEQYKFSGATDEEKAELLKEIVAFANAWRRTNAYIVVGVREVKGGKCLVEGIAGDLDDAQLQQFVQSKLNKPLEFSYAAGELDGKKVGLFTIAVQERPFFLKKEYGKLAANTVFIRRGSSTEIALPDEVAKMGAAELQKAERAPQLVPFVARDEHNEERAVGFFADVTIAEIPTKDEFNPPRAIRNDLNALAMQLALNRENKDYHYERAKHCKELWLHAPFRIGVENVGNLVARDVRVTVDFVGLPDGVQILHAASLPKGPRRYPDLLNLRNFSVPATHDMHVKRSANGYRVEVSLGKIQAKDTSSCSELLCIRTTQAISGTVRVAVYCDDLERPTVEECGLKIGTVERALSVADFVKQDPDEDQEADEE